MDYQKTFELYEKLYFHEVDVRENISARIQVPLVILISITSVYAYMAKSISTENLGFWGAVFVIAILISFALHIKSIFHFFRSFYGHEYEFLPSASDTENYRQELIETYKDFDNSAQLVSNYFDEYLLRYFNDCSSANTIVNDKRSEHLHKSNTFSILNVTPLVLAFLVFTFSGINKNSVDKEYKVNLTKPVTLSVNQAPIEVDANLDTTTLEIHFSDEIKDAIRERQTKVPSTASTATTASTSTSTEEDYKRGRTNSDQIQPNTKEMR